MTPAPVRLAIVVSHPIQYFAPVYRELARDASVDLTVLFATRVGLDGYYDPGFGQQVQWDIPLTDGYRSVFLSSRTRIGGLQWRIARELWRLRPDVVLFHGYNQPTNLLGIMVAKLMGCKVLMRGDTRLSTSNHKVGFKYLFKKWLFRRLDGFVSIGSLNRAYFAHFGVPENNIFFAPFCVDNRVFDLGSSSMIERSTIRADLDIAEDKKVVLFVAKLIARKRPQDLLEEFARVRRKYPDAVLVFAGSGEQEPGLRAEAAARGVNVRFLGFVNQSRLPSLYVASDFFVLPSFNEPWGLVVNEAMAAGLPVITTSDVGAAPDLVEGKGTGEIYTPGDVQALAAILDDWLSQPEKVAEMGGKAKALIAQWDISHCAHGIAQAAMHMKVMA